MTGQAEVVAEQVDELNNVLPDLLADATVPQALELLATVRGARQQLAELEAIVERHAAKAMDKKRVEWPGGVAEKHRGAARKQWLHDDLAHAVVMAKLVDPETGDLPGDEVRHVVERAMSGLLAAASVAYWRVGQLRQLGLEADSYCHSEPGRTTVEVHLGSEEQAA